jgi:hypothetical protein
MYSCLNFSNKVFTVMKYVSKSFSKFPQIHVFLDAEVTEYDMLQEYHHKAGGGLTVQKSVCIITFIIDRYKCL